MGLILVFDVDGTLGPVDGEPGQGLIPINPKVLEVIREAVSKRAGKMVDALFILSNNADMNYMNRIHARIQELLGINECIFDDIMCRGDYRRNMNAPRKSLEDVRYMIDSVNAKWSLARFFKSKPISLRGLAKRVYFFDDLHDHAIRGEIHNTRYIHINPSYTGSRSYKDKTRYYSLISEIRGKRRVTRKK